MSTNWYVWTKPPVFYSRFILSILQGTSDNYKGAQELVDKVRREKNEDMSERYATVIEVLRWRSLADYEGQLPDQETIRHLAISLEPDDGRWRNHPLRWYALAETYSLYAQSSRRLHDATTTDEFTDESASYFDRTWRSKSNLATRQLRHCAMRKKGNMYYRLGRYDKALEVWRIADREPCAGTRASVVFGLALTKRYDDAIREGKRAIEQMETHQLPIDCRSSQSALYINTAIAQWMLGQFDDALKNCQRAEALQNDTLNKLHVAHALILMGRRSEAERKLRSLMPPLTALNQKEVVTSPSQRGLTPGYVLWVLADPNAPLATQAARLYAARGEVREPTDLGAATGQQVSLLIHDVASYLEWNIGLCFEFMLVPSTKKQLDDLATRLQTYESNIIPVQ